MPSVELDGVLTAYEVNGTGPVIVVPACNVGWAAYGLDALHKRFTVVTVSPRGFLGSGRLPADDYSAAQITGDIERVLDDIGIGSYALLGYSLNGAVASYLALGQPPGAGNGVRGLPHDGLVLPGSPRAGAGSWPSDSSIRTMWAETVAVLDPAALMAFWDAVDSLPPAELVAGLDCPVWSWWGGDDPLFEPFGGVTAHREAIERLGLPYRELPGLDHDQALGQGRRLLPDLADWLESMAR